jgi:hypothetical protein
MLNSSLFIYEQVLLAIIIHYTIDLNMFLHIFTNVENSKCLKETPVISGIIHIYKPRDSKKTYELIKTISNAIEK